MYTICVTTWIILTTKDGLTLCHFFLDSAVLKSQTLSSLKTLTINKETTNELSMTSMSYTTMLTQTPSAGNVNA